MDFRDHAFLAAYANTSRRIADPAEAAKKAEQYADAAAEEHVFSGPRLRKPEPASGIPPAPKTVDLAAQDPKPKGRPRKKKE